MSAFFEAIIINPLLQAAILAALLASIVSGIIGSYVVVKRTAFISGGISHSVLGGIGLSIWLNANYGLSIPPLLGALIAAILSALIIGFIHLNYRQREDSSIAAIWSIGMALGILFISQTPGFNIELNNYLVGNILWTSTGDLYLLGLLDCIVLVVILPLHQYFLTLCFDEELAKLRGVPVRGLYLLLLILTSISVVLLVQVVGIVLVLTMLTIPAAIANLFTYRLSRMMVIAVLLAALFSLLGITLAYYLDWPTGATIALIAAVSYVIALLAKTRSISS